MNSQEVVVHSLPTLNRFLFRQRQTLIQLHQEKGISIPEEKIPEMELRGDTATLGLIFQPDIGTDIPYYIDDSNRSIWLHPQYLVAEVDAHMQRTNKENATLTMALVTLNTIALGIRGTTMERELNAAEEREVYQRTAYMMELFNELIKIEK